MGTSARITLGGEAKGCSKLPSVSKASNQPQLQAKETNKRQINHEFSGKLCSGALSGTDGGERTQKKIAGGTERGLGIVRLWVNEREIEASSGKLPAICESHVQRAGQCQSCSLRECKLVSKFDESVPQ